MLPAIAALSDASTVVERAAAYAPLVMFYSSVMIAISMFGGSAAVSPAYMADLFGSKYVGAIHGQLLSFLVLSGYAGPLTCTIMREASLRDAYVSQHRIHLEHNSQLLCRNTLLY